MYCITLLYNILLLSVVFCKNVGHRQARYGLAREPFTSTVTETSTIISLVPSSCVQVDSTLQPCRNVRFLGFPKFTENRSNNDSNVEAKSEQKNETASALGWGEYFGIYAPTLYTTKTELVTTQVVDTRLVVTFAIKGCIPDELPTSLNRCPSEIRSVPISRALPTSTIVPTATVPVTTPVNTKVIDVVRGPSFSVPEINENTINNNLEGSIDDSVTSRLDGATDPLPF